MVVYNLHGQTGGSTVWAIGTQNSGLVNFASESRLPFVEMCWFTEKRPRISDWNIPCGKTGLPFQMFLCSRKFSAGMTQKVVFHLLSNWIFRKILVNGKQPIYLIHGPRRGLIGTWPEMSWHSLKPDVTLLVSFLRLTFEIGIAEKESSANLPFVEIGRRGNVRADGDLNKRRIYDLSELLCAPQVRYRSVYERNRLFTIYQNFQSFHVQTAWQYNAQYKGLLNYRTWAG